MFHHIEAVSPTGFAEKRIAVGCGAATWPLAARAQQTDRMRRLGMLMVGDENDASRGQRAGSPGSRRGLRSWVGPMAATCAWTFVGSVTASTGRAYTQKNLSTSYSGWQPQTSSETRVDPHPDISFPHFLLRREPAACSINYFPTRKTFSSKRI